MQQTPNLKLNKIELTDSPPDITILNPNFERIEAELYPTIDPLVAPTGNTGFVKALLGGLANRIKAITGKTNWWDSPAKSLEQLNTDKVDKVAGKGLSTNDYTTAEKQQVAKISILETSMREMTKLKTNITITSTAWTKNATTQLWEYKLIDAHITANTMVDVNIQLDYLKKAYSLESVTESFSGYALLYAVDKPSEDIVVDMKLIRQVV